MTDAPTKPSKPTLITVDVGNNPARCRMLIYHKGLEEQIDLKTPGDFGGTSSASYRALNPQGKIPVLLLPDGTAFFEARVILNYLAEKYADVGPAVGAATPEERALAAMITQVHDIYIASPNSSDPSVTATQGAMYKGVDAIDAASRAAKFAELDKQLDVLESLLSKEGPYAAGASLTEADFSLYPTVCVFIWHMLPAMYGWPNPLWPGRRPKLFEWQEKVSALPAAQRVRKEVMAGIEAWVTAKRFDPIKEQIAAHPELKWVFGRE